MQKEVDELRREVVELEVAEQAQTEPTADERGRDDRVIRVFISSTFRDMQTERDLLVKQVFPTLRRKCAKRFVTFTEVDLRWGITEEQSAEGQVLPLCLAEIERSRPYFIGLLGERYGWIPDTIRPEMIKREKWLKEHVGDRKSVSELEILHGVLNRKDKKMKGHAFFYFRDPAYVNDPSLSDDDRREMTERNIPAEVKDYGEAEATRRTEARKAKLSALKQRIRDSGLPLVDPYANPEALAEVVYRQFDELIDRLYPEDEAPDPLAQERMAHEAFAKSKLFGCIDRPEHMAILNQFADRADNEGKGFVLSGESGGGKTSLLAAWAQKWAEDNPGEFLFQQYFGSTPESASPEGFLRRLMGELKQQFDITEDIPSEPDKLRDTLPVWLAMTPPDIQVTLVLDGLNQVQGSEPDQRLNFLPRHFPPHVTVIASTLPGPALDALNDRGWEKYELPLATEAEADAMVANYLKEIGRFVDADGNPIETPLRSQIVAAPGSRNPLFLRTVLEELRQFGSFEELPDRVAHYLEASDPKELFLRVIRRWQEDFDGRDPKGRDRDLTHRVLTYLWAARQGLSEPEWLDLLGPSSEEPLPRALWTPLFLALEPHLGQRTGLFAYGHDFLRQAVEETWLTTEEAQRAAHLAIADYFEHHPSQTEMTDRKAAEWPFHLQKAQSWNRLEACLTDMSLFLALYNDQTKWELTYYWHPLRSEPFKRKIEKCYAEAFRRWPSTSSASRASCAGILGTFLFENGVYETARQFLHAAWRGIAETAGLHHPATLTAMTNLAMCIHESGDSNEAESMLRSSLNLREKILGPEHVDTLISMNNLALHLHKKGNYVEAESLYRRCLRLREQTFGKYSGEVCVSMNNLGLLMHDTNRFDAAISMHRRAFDHCRDRLSDEHPDCIASLHNLAGDMRSKGDYEAAKPLQERVLELSKRVLGEDHPTTITATCNLGGVVELMGDFAMAEQLFRKGLLLSENVLGIEHPLTLVRAGNLANVLRSRGLYREAEGLFRRVLSCRESTVGLEHIDTLNSLDDLALLYLTSGDYVRAISMCRRAVSTCEAIFGVHHSSTVQHMRSLAKVLKISGDTAGADSTYRRLLTITSSLHGADHPITLECINQIADLLVGKGDFTSAKEFYIQLESARTRTLGDEHPDTLLTKSNLAGILECERDYVGAEQLWRAVLSVRERVYGWENFDTVVSANNLGSLLLKQGDTESAASFCRKAVTGMLGLSASSRQVHGKLKSLLNNYAACLLEQGYDNAEIRRIIDAMLKQFGMIRLNGKIAFLSSVS